MIKLIILEDDKPIFNPEVRMFAPFRKIIERDKGRNSERGISEKGDPDGRRKYIATKELAFIYWFIDPRSTYKESYADLKEREIKIKKLLDLPTEWKMDSVMEEAIIFYEAEIREDFDVQYLESAVSAAAKTKDYFNEVDYSKVDNKGQRIYKVKEVTDALKNSSSVLEDLKKLRTKVFKSEVLSRNIRGGGTVGRFED